MNRLKESPSGLLWLIGGIIIGFAAAAFLCFEIPVVPADAQGVGFFGTSSTGTRTNCTAITSPVVGQTVCFDQAANTWKVYTGASQTAAQWVSGAATQTGVNNVRDFGAKGDGATDDTAAFQRAIDAAQGLGGVVAVPPASVRYLVGGALTVNPTLPPLSIIGAGKYASVVRYSGAGTWLSASGGLGPIMLYLADFTLELTGASAIGIDCSQCQSSTIRSVRIVRQAGAGQIGINARPTSSASQPFFTVVDDVTFESLGTGVVLDSAVGNAPNRWRLVNNSFLGNNGVGVAGIKIGTNSANLVSGTDLIGNYFNELSGVAITLGPNTDRTTLVDTRQETSSGGTLFSIDPASNRTMILGYMSHAGAIGIPFGATSGTRTVILGGWDDLRVGNSVSGGADLVALNTSGNNGGLTVDVANDQGTGTVSVASGVYMNATQTLWVGGANVPRCTNNCGTNPSVAGTNTAMRVTMGATGSPRSPFLVLFNGTWNAAPACIAQLNTATSTTATVANATTTGVLVNTILGPAQGDVYSIHCLGVG